MEKEQNQEGKGEERTECSPSGAKADRGYRAGFLRGSMLGALFTFGLCLGGYQLSRASLSFSSFSGKTASGSEAESGKLDMGRVKRKLSKLQEYIERDYLYQEDSEKAEEGIYKGLVNSLRSEDPYAFYYTKEELSEDQSMHRGVYQGIGAAVQQDPETNICTVETVYPGSPAERAGLLRGDVIRRIDGIDIRSMNLRYIVDNLVRGAEGSSMELTIERGEETISLRVERGEVNIPAVRAGTLESLGIGGRDSDIGYISLSSFYEKGEKDFLAALDSLCEKPVKGLIIDLRGNPGGDVEVAAKLLDYILPDDLGSFTDGKAGFQEGRTLLVYTRDKHDKGKEWYAKDGHSVELPIVILQNQNSASASELFAGALQDYQRALIMGSRSYGKGIVQTIRKFTDGSAIEFTTHFYYTPSGRNIHKTGIEADIGLPEESGAEASDGDSQIESAAAELRRRGS